MTKYLSLNFKYMENYYFWLSAFSRKKILLRTFVKSWKWTLPSLIVAGLGYFLLYDILKASHFNAFLSLLTSLSLFAVVKYKDKLKKKNIFLFRASYTAATGIILFWMLIALGLPKLGILLSLALVLFFISPFLNYLPFKLSKERIMFTIWILIILALGIDFINSFNGDFACRFASFAFCFGFMLFNAYELKQMDKDLQYGLTKEDIKKMTDDWCFDLSVNFLGMICFAEAVRLVAKMIYVTPDKKIVLPQSSQKVVS